MFVVGAFAAASINVVVYFDAFSLGLVFDQVFEGSVSKNRNNYFPRLDVTAAGSSGTSCTPRARATRSTRELGRPKDGLGIYIYSCHAGELFGFVPVARDEQAFSC